MKFRKVLFGEDLTECHGKKCMKLANGAGGVVQWYSVCLALKKKMIKNEQMNE